jgi:hypothetical protein
VFVQHPISAGFIAISALLISGRLFVWLRGRRRADATVAP